jgi:hypothetical protein
MTSAPFNLPANLELTAILLIVLGSFCAGFILSRTIRPRGRQSVAAPVDTVIYVLFLVIAFLLGIFATYLFFITIA